MLLVARSTKMDFKLVILLTLSTCWTLAYSADSSSEALRECGNLHHLEFHNLPNARAEFAASNCMLKCEIGDKVLSNDPINEGFFCPGDKNGVCRGGKCEVHPVASNLDAQRECGNLHHAIDFHNSTGSLFSPDHCELKCALNGNIISSNHLNEGYPCLNEPKKICRLGQCVSLELAHSTPIPVATTKVPVPTTPTPSIALMLPGYQIDEIELEIASLSFPKITFFYQLQAVACIEKFQDQICHTIDFHRICQTAKVGISTSTPHWNEHCYLHGPFNSTESLILHVRYSHDIAIGSHVENLNALFNRHYTAKHFDAVPASFLVEEELEIVTEDRLLVANVKVSLLYHLSKI